MTIFILVFFPIADLKDFSSVTLHWLKYVHTNKATIFFICWITSHFHEFQSVVVGKEIKMKIECGSKLHYFHSSELFMLVLHYVLCKFLAQNMNHCQNLIIKLNV